MSALTNCRGSARDSCLRALIEIVHGHGAAERQLHMRVRVDAARDDQAIGRIDDPYTARHHKVRARAHVLDDAVLDVDVGRKRAVMVDNLAPFDVQAALRALCEWCANAFSNFAARVCLLTWTFVYLPASEWESS